jgi:hypothetical protein
MKNYKKITISSLLLTLLVSCTPPAVVKKDVQVNSEAVRKDVIELQSRDPASDLD